MARILLVEDDEALRVMTRGALELRGHAVREARDRPSALAILEADAGIELLLLDLGLPPASHAIDEGIAVLEAVHAQAWPVKVVVLTGQDQEAAAFAAIRAGAFDFLAKPAGLDAIAQALDRAHLFLRKEREMAAAGIVRLRIDTPLAEGPRTARDEAEERLLRRVLRDTGFNVHEAARRLGIKRENVYYFIKKYGIVRE